MVEYLFAKGNAEYPINVKKLINGIYCGVGKFCKDFDEAWEYITSQAN